MALQDTVLLIDNGSQRAAALNHTVTVQECLTDKLLGALEHVP